MSSTLQERANILLISSDSMDGRIMGCAGHPAADTPNFDRLAARGVLFQNAYCNSPQCVPSRASMWSGRFTHVIEGWNNRKGLEPDDPTFMTDLAAAGYRTHCVGRHDHLSGAHSIKARVNAWTRGADLDLPQRGPCSVRVDETDEPRYKTGDWERVDEAVRWLGEEGDGDRPFLLSVGVGIPHPPFHTNRYWLDRIDPDQVTLPPEDEQSHSVMEAMRTAKCCPSLVPEEILAIRHIYYAMVAETDGMVGQVLAALDDLGLAESTCVIYLSDHGEMNMEHGQFLKNALYEASARVPLIVSTPGGEQDAVVEDLVSLVDIRSTLDDLAGAAQPDGLDGYSLVPYLEGRPSERSDWVLSEYHSNFQPTSSFMLRRGPWKYIAYGEGEPQLFNLDEDPEEIHNLAEALPEKAHGMDAKLREIVDYPAVNDTVEAYGLRSFNEWRAALTEAEYAEALRQLYPDHCDAARRGLEAWAKT